MGTIVLAAALVVACSTLVGQWICTLAGHERWHAWSPGVGFAALLSLGGILIRAPGHAWTVAVAIAAATLTGLASPTTRAAVRSGLGELVPVAGVALLAAMVPFLVDGGAGILGAGMNNDSGAHLGTAWWLMNQRGPQPVGALGGALAGVGYPIGPHGLFAALSLDRISLVHTYDAVIIAVVPLTAIVALGALPRAGAAARFVAALFVGLAYLGLSFTLQASFKETMEALFVIAAVPATQAALRDGRWRAGIPVGVLLAGTVWIYSYGGVVWVGAAAVAVVAVSGSWRSLLRPVLGAAVAAAVLVAPALPDIGRFASSPFNHEVGDGNLLHPLSPIEGLGVWFGYDFRWTPDPLWPTIAAAAVVGLAALIALTRLVRAHELALPAALIPVLGVYAYAADEKSIYLSAKTLAVASPLVALVIAAGMLAPPRSESVPRVLRVGHVLLAALVAAAGLFSSAWALRDARVGPTAHAAELSRLKPLMLHGDVLYMGKDDLIQWELVGVPLYQGRNFYAPLSVHARPSKPNLKGGEFDFDSFLPATLNKFRYALTSRSPFQSHAPRNWRPIASTRSFVLWKRRGRTPLRYPTDFYNQPMLRLDCSTDYGRTRLGGARGGFALVRARPIVGQATHWNRVAIAAGQSASMTLRVPRGRWDLSLTYAARTGLRVQARDLDVRMPATVDRVGSYYLAGTVMQTAPGPLTITATFEPGGGIARMLGAPLRTRGLDTPSNWPLGTIALTRHDERVSRVEPTAACGKWVDFVQPPSVL